MRKFRSIVVKIEYTTFASADGKIDPKKMERMAMILSNLHNSGKHLLIVTSGAIALGSVRLKNNLLSQGLIGQQALAAVGQAELIKNYQNYFEIFNQRVAQVLLTSDIIENEVRKQNALNTFNTLFALDIIPVINENDVVSTEDIEFNDNYPLTKNVAVLSGSDMIIIKGDNESDYYILMKGSRLAKHVESEDKLINEVEIQFSQFDEDKAENLYFPEFFNEIKFQ